MKQYQRIRGTSSELDAIAKEHRRTPTEAEEALWQALSGKKLDGYKFRRQHPLGQFVLDFCCPAQRLIVEVDGGIHDTQQEHDAARDAQLAVYGYKTLRLSNEEVLTDLSAALARTRSALKPP
jgi:very-short-patch-repair endonuclease